MVYFDNASTSYPKPECVYTEMDRCLREYCANPGRGAHAMSRTAAQGVAETRAIIARFFNFGDPERIIFTKNATEALNIAIKGSLRRGDHVIATMMEHNSVVRPLIELEKENGVEVTFLAGDMYGEVTPSDVAANIRRNTRLIVCTISANTNGIFMPVAEIGNIANRYGIPFLVDGSQGAGSVDIDFKAMKINLLAFPGHKGLFGPQGTGGLCISPGIELKPLLQGGTGSDSENPSQPQVLPEALESGTLNTPGIIGLGAGVFFINQVGRQNIEDHKQRLITRMHEELSIHPKIHIYSSKEPGKNSGVVAINIDGIVSTHVSKILDEQYSIATRAGLHCAPFAHKALGYTAKGGVLRLSVGYFNTQDEVEFTLHALQEIADRSVDVPYELKTHQCIQCGACSRSF
ncbi:cysteine desulfurase family protein [Syntrophus gentianae]|uniref:cysteine desulfurase n=1 Tax=Syntrophus gentianae TaxID=43775 RepID=A0A1H7XUM5_9BACT|nr:aminotransferase class V-fold PLP-dependent enzyme [Syntrophus gentianae]SEM37343.1 cysteine desulfurase family protein [Syntrophus gentianae]